MQPKGNRFSKCKCSFLLFLRLHFDCVQGENPILSAGALGRPRVIRMLVQAKADINGRNDKARASCQLIVCVVVFSLLNQCIDIDCDLQGETPIFVAGLHGWVPETVETLIQLKANINECNQKAIDVGLASAVCFAVP